jgi:hypothetical protein
MNLPPPDNVALHMPAVLHKLKALGARLAILEMRITAELAASSLPHSHLPKIAKNQIPPPLNHH